MHTLSEYSLLASALRIREMVRLAAEHAMPAIALTDRMNMHGAITFYDECYRRGIKPLLGVEIAMESITAVKHSDPKRPDVYDLVLIAEDNTGYERLCELLTRIHTERDTYLLCARKEWLEELAGHWFVLSGGRTGEVFRLLARQEETQARRAAEWLTYISGPGKFYIELQYHDLPEQRIVVPKLIELARSCSIPMVATNECRYATSDEAVAVEILRRIENGTTCDSIEDLKPETKQMYFRTYEEMAAVFKNVKEALDNTCVISDQCAVELSLGTSYLTPTVTPPGGLTARQYLEELCTAGLQARYPDWDDSEAAAEQHLTKKKRQEIEKRLAYELEMITDMGFLSYFLVVQDFVSFARKQGIPVGPGRGSAAGSLVSYLLGITMIDPLDFGLLFERFLNPARRKMPDFDIDFCERRREEVIRYVREKYGNGNVAQIATFSTLRYKAALRDVGRVLRMSDPVIDKLCLLLNDYARTHAGIRYSVIAQACRTYDPLRELYLRDRQAKIALDLGMKIEDLPRNISTHAAGVVISPKPLRTFVPLDRAGEGETITQYDMHAIDRLGLLKIDFLGLTTLTIIYDALALIRQTHGIEVDLQSLALDDEKTFAMLRSGDVFGVFQLESSQGMRQLVQELQPKALTDIIALVALYRPGPMHNRKEFVARRLGTEEIVYPHPKLKTILKETYGIMLYQEQIIQCLHSLLGYSLADADVFRQIMSKKESRRIESEREKFMQHAAGKNIETELAEALFNDISQFAGYGFNKSHATAYAFVAYWTAWLKANYPAEFLAALLNSKLDSIDRFSECQQSCKTLGIAILPPDVNESVAQFSVKKTSEDCYAIRFGLEAIHGVGPGASGEIVRERTAHGEYRSLDDFCRRVDQRAVNRKVLECLVKAGACDFTGLPRQRMALIADDIASSWEKSGESQLQRSFFDTFDDQQSEQPAVPRALEHIGEWDSITVLKYEKEMTGIYLSGHPLDSHASAWRALVTADARNTGYAVSDQEDTDSSFGSFGSDATVIMGGLLLKAEWRTSRKKRSYGVLTFEDYYGTFTALLWSEMVEKYRAVLENGQIRFAQGVLRESFGRTTLSAAELASPEEALQRWPGHVRVNLVQNAQTKEQLAGLSALISAHAGQRPIELVITDPGTDRAAVISSERMAIELTEEILREIEAIAGLGAVSVRMGDG